MRRFFFTLSPVYVVSSLLLVSCISSIFLSHIANAASTPTVSSSLKIGDPSSTPSCSDDDVTLNWANFMQPHTSSPDMGYQASVDYIHNFYSYSQSSITDFVTKFMNNINSNASDGVPHGWGVAQGSYGGDTVKIYVFNQNTQLNVNTDGSISTTDGSQIDTLEIMKNSGWSCGYQYHGTGSSDYSSSSSISGTDIFILNAIKINYPSDYSGPELPSSYTPPSMETPIINFTVNDKKIDAWYGGGLSNVDNTCVSFTWNLYKTSDSSTVVNTQSFQNTVEHFRFTVTGDDSYSLLLGPSVPSPCNLHPDPSIIWQPSIVQIKIDGSSYSGSTYNSDCTLSATGANCVTKSTVQVCIDSSDHDFVSTANCKLQAAFNIGLINPSIESFKAIFTSFTVPDNPSCTLDIPNVTVSGHIFPMSSYPSQICSSAAQLRTAFPIAPTMVNFFFALLNLFLIVQLINRLADLNHNDMIEGV